MPTTLPEALIIDRGQTQVGVNKAVLTYLYQQLQANANLSFLDLPCGNQEFLKYIKILFPQANVTGGDIAQPTETPGIGFLQMDLTKDFPFGKDIKFDVITCISGVMMFGNTLAFIRNCADHLKPQGKLVITNDNAATIKDRLSFLLLGRYRMFNLAFANSEHLTENLPISSLCHILRTNNIDIEKIEYTSLYMKDLIFLPLALIVYFFQYVYMLRVKRQFPEHSISAMYPFKHLLCRHYIMYGSKKSVS